MEPLSSTIVTKIGTSVATGIGKRVFKKVLDEPKKTAFEAKLIEVIDKSIEKYIEKYKPIRKFENNKFSFIDSAPFVEVLLSYSFFDNLEEDSFYERIKDFELVKTPNEKELQDFLVIFNQEVDNVEDFDLIEIKSDSSKILKKVHSEVERLRTSVEGTIVNLNEELNNEFKSELEAFHNDILNFKPKSALNHLELLKSRVEGSDKVSAPIKAKVHSLIGIAYGELLNMEKRNEYFVKSYYDSTNSIKFKTYGLIGFYESGDFTMAEKLIEEIIQNDPLNETANGIKAIMFPDWIKECPNVVLKNEKFKHIWAQNLYKNKKYQEAYEYMENEIMALQGAEYKVNQENYKRLLLYAQLSIHQALKNSDKTFLFVWDDQSKNIHLINGIRILDAIIHSIQDSEIYDKYLDAHFLLHYASFLQSGAKENLSQMEMIYSKLPLTIKKNRCENLAVSYSQKGKFQKSLDILEEVNFGNFNTNYFLGSFMARELRQYDKSLKYLECYIKSLDRINDEQLVAVFQYINTKFDLPDEKKAFVQEIKSKISDKKMELLLEVVTDLENNIRWEDTQGEQLLSILNEPDDQFLRAISVTLMNKGDKETALHVLDSKGIVDENSENADVLIELLYETKQQSNRLLDILESKRDEFNIDWLLYEVHLLSHIPEWETIVAISKNALKKFPNHSGLLRNLIFALNNLNRTDDIKSLFSEGEINFSNWTQSTIFNIAQVLIEVDLTELALDITFPFAIDQDNTWAREMYVFSLSRNVNIDDFTKDSISPGTMVFTKINGIETSFDVNENNLETNPTIRMIRASSPGESLETEDGNTIEILSILPRKYGLIRKIFIDINNRPHSGYSVKQLTFDPSDPKSLLEVLSAQTDKKKEKDRQDKIKRMISDYNAFNQSFGNLARTIFQENYVECYEYLTQTNGQFNTKPLIHFRGLKLYENVEYVIDWSVIPLMVNLSNNKAFVPNKKFIISSSVISNINDMIKNAINNSPSLTVRFLDDKAIPIAYPDDYSDRRVKILTEVKNWIESNCRVETVREKLEVVMQLYQNEKYDSFTSQVIDNVYLANRNGYVLITDDDIYDPFGLIKVGHQVSSQFYLNDTMPDEWDSFVVQELLKYNYRGLAINANILTDAYSLISDVKSERFVSALKNLPVNISKNPEIIGEIMKFVKYIYLLDISKDQKKRQTINVFVNGLKGLDIPDLETNLLKYIAILFAQHPNLIESVQDDLNSAFSVINS